MSPAGTAADAALGVYREILAAPEVAIWRGGDVLSLGCAEGGYLRLDPIDTDGRADVSLHGCSWASNATFDGTGWIDLSSTSASLDLLATRGRLHLEADLDGDHLTGTWGGTTIDERH
jgi:hypothetical protein